MGMFILSSILVIALITADGYNMASTRRSVSFSMCANYGMSKATVMMKKKKLKEIDGIKSIMAKEKENVINVS